jgi:hypothetical protein
MLKFKLDKTNKARIEVFADYVKRVGVFCPLNDRQLFLYDAPKQTLKMVAMGKSAGGGNGVVDSYAAATADSPKDDASTESFISTAAQVVNAISKIQSDDVLITIDGQRVIFSSPTQSRNTITLNTLIKMGADEIAEYDQFIKTKLNEPYFADPIKFTLDDASRTIITSFSGLTKLCDVSDSIQITENAVLASDNVCVASLKIPSKSIVREEVLLNRDVVDVLKNATEMMYSSDKKYLYINVAPFGVRILTCPRLPKWAYPTDEELKVLMPTDDEKVSLTISANKFFETLSMFSGMFETSKWRYSQVRLETSIDKLPTDKETLLHFDDMATEVRQFLPIDDVSITGVTDSFEYTLPCLHINHLESIIKKAPSLTLEYNGRDPTDENGRTAKLVSGDLTLIVAKLLD